MPVLVSSRWKSGTLGPQGPTRTDWWRWLQKSKQKLGKTEERVKCTQGKTGASQGRDPDGSGSWKTQKDSNTVVSLNFPRSIGNTHLGL